MDGGISPSSMDMGDKGGLGVARTGDTVCYGSAVAKLDMTSD